MNGAFNIKLLWPRPMGRGQKVKYHLISITKSISKFFFILNFVCVNDTKHIKRDLHYVAWVMPQGWDIGALGCPGGGVKNMVMWPIKSTGMTSRTECKLSFYPRVKLVTLGVRSKCQISLI